MNTNTIKIDLFSDTNTNPSLEMRKAMCEAEVGNEVAGEDPTVNRLLEKVCSLLEKEAAIFLPSGTMCNGIAYRVLCQRPGDIIILDKTAHSFTKEAGLISGLAQAQPFIVEGNRGIFTAKQIQKIIQTKPGYNLSRYRVISIEQSTNLGGGAIWPLSIIEEVCSLAHKYGVATHMDGARLVNAMSETSIPAARYAQNFDSVWIDFSKSLGAPMGAVLAGSKEFINQAWYYKFQQGGGMHQAGILAAGCLYSLEHNLQKIPEIHFNTKKLAGLLSELPFIKCNLDHVETNVIIFKVDHPTLTANDFGKLLLEKGIRILVLDENYIRIMVHLDINVSHITAIVETIREIGKNV